MLAPSTTACSPTCSGITVDVMAPHLSTTVPTHISRATTVSQRHKKSVTKTAKYLGKTDQQVSTVTRAGVV